MTFDGQPVAMLYEDRSIYDGWSVAELADGTLVNRWAGLEGFERRAEAAERYLEQIKAARL